jgi:hypothetical protein
MFARLQNEVLWAQHVLCNLKQYISSEISIPKYVIICTLKCNVTLYESCTNNNGVSDVMIGFIWTPYTLTNLGTTADYRATADFHTLQFIVAHALGFSVSTSRSLATDLNTGTTTSIHYEVFL